MTSWLSWDISDDIGENPLGKPGEFEFDIEFDYDPGDPGCWRDSNGDGYPGYPPSATVSSALCKTIKIDDLPPRAPTAEEIKLLEKWFLEILDNNQKLRQQIELCGLEQMTVEPDCDDLND